MAAALAYPTTTPYRGCAEPVFSSQTVCVTQFARHTAKLLGFSEFARLNVEPLAQAFAALRLNPVSNLDRASALFDPRVFDAWNQLVHGLLWRGTGLGGKSATPALVRDLYQAGPAETAALRAIVLVGISQPTVQMLSGLRALALAGEWNEQRAAAVIHLLLLSPEYWKRHLV